MKKFMFALLSAVMLFICIVPAALAEYSSPFALPEEAQPGAANSAAELKYSLREGGTFMYCNNPEQLFDYNIGKALMIENDITGDVYFTNENRNMSERDIYTGLQVRNNSGEDITVTVKNIGYTFSGSDWFGQDEWTDFFNTTYRLEQTSGQFSFSRPSTPKPFEPQTFTVPDGEYVYVMGGTTKDACGNANPGGTADLPVHDGDIINGAVYFTVEGPETGVSAAFVCYESADEPVLSAEQQGYIVEKGGKSFGRQYLGTAPYLCAESSMAWNINDDFADGGRLPVKYSVTYYNNTSAAGNYGAYSNPLKNTVTGTTWYTHLNSANHNTYVGTDMMPFYCVTEADGTPVLIDVHHNDGTGKPANIGNWMVIYEEYLGFTNSGKTARDFKLYIKVKGLLAVNVRDENGGLIDSFYHNDSAAPVFELEVAGGKTGGVYLEYVLLADCYGSIEHYVTAEKVQTAPDYIPGDVNGNGKIDTADYAMAKRAYLRTFTLTEDQLMRADINGNSKLDASEYAMIKRHYLKTYVIPGAEGK
ncbi:MAG: hypothetical protein J5925_02315 [Clostridia bacterium]|nr:hypothetical protein [Clostridia bacterium]